MKQWVLLKRQPVAENEWLLNIFSRTDGHLQVRLGPPNIIPDYLSLYTGEWRSERDWPQLKGVEAQQAYRLQDNALICALYLNELLLCLLPLNEPHSDFFDYYLQTLDALGHSTTPEVWLRVFEQGLLQIAGYGIDWEHAGGVSIDPAAMYTFESGVGFVVATSGWQGDKLLAIARGNFLEPGVLMIARQVLRQAIETILARPLVSRELLTSRG